ncbi:MAG: MBL fold metallo-hydrolase [Thermovirgaceae bacterium]|nr:MBL fold metallo-hydrolase [Synergistales bacterium]HPC75837.1 MBL fold metallo-hydrolase [Synergistales bacterium]HRS48605.1 MBL fold metallo-hydrolase [Thermovirgaceae bacterium]HRU90806.1 MBL fold metallo-hydrolase [Thermovirgaceae bacterium]
MPIRLRVLGAAGEVTGSNYILESGGTRLMVDCGLHQGGNEYKNREPFAFDPSTIDAVLLTHAHLDHTGRVPLLVKMGFKGKVIATAPTVDLTDVLWRDAAKIQKEDAEWKTRKNRRKGLDPEEPLYTEEDVGKASDLLLPVAYDDMLEPVPGFRVRFRDAGHILGSANIEVWGNAGDGEVKIVFSGDLGPQQTVMERTPSVLEDADYVVIESTYGDREHKTNEESREEFREAMKVMIQDHGKVLIPTFVVDRAQRVLYEIMLMQKDGVLPPGIPIYFDSPMGEKATEVYNKHLSLLSSEIQEQIRAGNDPFSPENLRIVSDVEESKRINKVKEAVVLAGSGMCNGGRIVHHLKNSLFLETTDVVFVGYQARSTLGRRLVEGEKYVRVAGEEVAVRAKIHTINGFSAHADRRDLLAWARQFRTDPLFFITHGEQESSLALSKTFDENGIRSFIPEEGGEYSLVGKNGAVSPPGMMGMRTAAAVAGETPGRRAVDAVLGDIVTLAAELREDGSSLPREEALNLALSARTLLKTLKRRGTDD